MQNITPKQIVAYLDEYVIGQNEAKKTISLAIRNRYRRMLLDKDMQDEVMPKNILMIGSTGIGKTEIARRLAKLMNTPFIKVEASKYTEVGFVGRDVESMVRDLVLNSFSIVKAEFEKGMADDMQNYILERILDKLLPPIPKVSTQEKKNQYENSRALMKDKIISGEMDDKKIKINIPKSSSFEGNDSNMPQDLIKVQESISKIISGLNKNEQEKEVSIKDAKEILKIEASEVLLDIEAVKKEALKRAERGGIIFLDEIDKIATSKNSRNDPSKEGVQRDLLPIIEGSVVNTKYGTVSTDHILFIAAGAFHVSKPGDLIPELQGRFPLRVELSSLDEDAIYDILTKSKNSLLKQYKALLLVDNIEVEFEPDAVRKMAKLTQEANEKMEDIGARRLHTIIEKIVEDLSFDIEHFSKGKNIIDVNWIDKKLGDLIENEDSSRYIL